MFPASAVILLLVMMQERTAVTRRTIDSLLVVVVVVVVLVSHSLDAGSHGSASCTDLVSQNSLTCRRWCILSAFLVTLTASHRGY